MTSPPSYTGDEWYWKHKEAFELLDWEGKHLQLPESAIAESVEQAERDVANAQLDVEEAQYYVDHPQSERPDMLANDNLKLADAKWIAGLMKVRLLRTKIAKLEEKPKATDFSKSSEGPSAFFPSIAVKSGRRLKTRRHKHRNGSTRVLKHKTRHLSKRQVKA